MFKRALVTVYDKTGLYEWLQPLQQQGLEIVSTGGTAQFLKSKGLKVTLIEEQTGFPEILEGRVKTLHPFVHIPILARKWEQDDQKVLENYQLKAFDLLVCNLYPFSEHQDTQDKKQLVEWIDIGGPTLLRAAAKNFFSITTLCSPEDYSKVKKPTTLEQRQKLASKAFLHVSQYDALIASTLGSKKDISVNPSFFQTLRYGENPSQEASWHILEGEHGLHKLNKQHGRQLSFNNLLDVNVAYRLLSDFSDRPTAVAIKHNNPCGLASSDSIDKAVSLCLKADPKSVFGGVFACNREIDEALAENLDKCFLELILAPKYSKQALKVLTQKKNRILLQLDASSNFTFSDKQELKQILGGFLLQDQDRACLSFQESWQVIGETPSDKVKKDILFCWKLCSHLKSNAIAIAKDERSLGLGMGQVSRVEACQQALQRWKEHHPQESKDIVLASDAFFPFPDSIERAAAEGVKWIIQPGGSVKDKDVIQAAQDLGVSLILTKQRHFRH